MIFYNKAYNCYLNKQYNNIKKNYKVKSEETIQSYDEILWEWNINTKEFNINFIGYDILGIKKYYKKKDDIEFWKQFIHPDDVEYSFDKILKDIVSDDKKKFSNEYRIIRADGTVGKLITSGISYRNIHDEKIIVEYIDKFKQYENLWFDKSKESSYPYIGGGIDGVINIDTKNKKIKMSPSINAVLDELNLNQKINSLNQCIEYFTKDDTLKYIKSFNEFLKSGEIYYYNQFRLINKRNNEKWIEIRGQANLDNLGNKDKLYVSVKDITREKEEKRKYSQIRYIDDITELPNKFFLREILMKKDVENSTKIKEKMTLMLVDIDDFKEINDKLGYDFGNKLLKAVGEKIKSGVDKKDTVFRYNADEFFILYEDFTGYMSIKENAKKVIDLFKYPLKIDKKDFFVSVNVGIAIYPDHGAIISDLIYKADIAMFKSKSIGKNTFSIFEVDKCDEVNRIFNMEQDLVKAINKNEMYVVFQPKINIKDEKTIGLEALLRWNHGKKGVIPPSKFIPIAESTKLIIPIGRFVFEEACKKCRELLENGYDDFKISVNLSKIQLEDKLLTEFLKDTLKKYNLKPKFIELEITESLIMDALEKNLAILDNIHDYGISISLDDFGVGLSPIKYLKILNLDCLKIDKSFIDDIGVNEKSERIIEGLIKLAHSLNLLVIAEGVEKEEQINYLKKHCCDIVQGYYYAKPMSFNDTITFLKKENISKKR